MDILKKFLDRFEKIKNPKDDKIKIAETLTVFLNEKVEPEQIVFNSGNISILKIHPVLKNQVFFNKEKIIDLLKEKHPSIKVYDIR